MKIVEPPTKVPRTIKLNSADNIVVAVDNVEKGASSSGIVASARVPRGHKMAVVAIAKGEPIRKFGQIIGFAKAPIQPGDWVHEHNVEMHDFARDYAYCADAKPEEILPASQQATFEGYRVDDQASDRAVVSRGDRRVGARERRTISSAKELPDRRTEPAARSWTVGIVTRDYPADFARCLAGALAFLPPDGEVVVRVADFGPAPITLRQWLVGVVEQTLRHAGNSGTTVVLYPSEPARASDFDLLVRLR